jgi:hypothetical protein
MPTSSPACKAVFRDLKDAPAGLPFDGQHATTLLSTTGLPADNVLNAIDALMRSGDVLQQHPPLSGAGQGKPRPIYVLARGAKNPGRRTPRASPWTVAAVGVALAVFLLIVASLWPEVRDFVYSESRTLTAVLTGTFAVAALGATIGKAYQDQPVPTGWDYLLALAGLVAFVAGAVALAEKGSVAYAAGVVLGILACSLAYGGERRLRS